jgi:hypothetical protein
MSRRFRMLLALMMGVMLTVLTAWVSAWHKTTWTKKTEVSNSAWPAEVPTDWPPKVEQSVYEGLGKRLGIWIALVEPHFVTRGQERLQIPSSIYAYVAYEIGWPLRSMERIETYPSIDIEPLQSSLPVPQSLQRLGNEGWTHRLPLVPIPLGFAVNTAFYGTLTWLGLVGLAWFARRSRRRRGLCVACKYPIAGLAMCPECGLAVAQNGSITPSSVETSNAASARTRP